MTETINSEQVPAELVETRSILKRHPFSAYVFLAYALTWVSLAPLVLSSMGIIEVSINWHFIGALGPTIAAIVVIYMLSGRDGIKQLGRRCMQWNKWTAISILIPIFLFTFALIADYLSSGTWYDLNAYVVENQLTTASAVFFWILPIVAYGIFEEIGWRGFALPKLQAKYSAIAASTFLWIIHFLWHIPMFFYRFTFDLGMIIGFSIGMFVGTIVLTFILNSSNGSILATIAWHFTFNLVSVMSVYTMQAYMSMGIMLIALILVIRYGRRELSTGEKYSG